MSVEKLKEDLTEGEIADIKSTIAFDKVQDLLEQTAVETEEESEEASEEESDVESEDEPDVESEEEPDVESEDDQEPAQDAEKLEQATPEAE